MLARYGWLAHCSSAFRDFMLANLHEQDVSPGVAMTHAGDSEGGFYGLIEGQIAFVTTIGNAGVGVSQFGFPGSWWGQGPLLGNDRIGFATAETACRIGVAPLRLLRAHLINIPGHWEDIAQCMADLFLTAEGAHADAIIPDHRQRLAATLLRLGGRRHRRFPVQVPESFVCTQEALAGALGVARNTAGRLCRSLEAEGLIQARYGRLSLVDISRLEVLANAD